MVTQGFAKFSIGALIKLVYFDCVKKGQNTAILITSSLKTDFAGQSG